METPEQKEQGVWNKWAIVGYDGLPRPGWFANMQPSGWFAVGFVKPNFIREISADGENLICISDDYTIHYAKFPNEKSSKFVWQARWGLYLWLGVALGPPGWVHLPPNKGWSISHKGPLMKYYADINGTKQFMTVGVTTLYLLDDTGYDIWYVDPWLPPCFAKHHLDTPYRGRLIAKRLTASGSTILIICENGDMWTRLVDFDLIGLNPMFNYTFERGSFKDNTKFALPDHGWMKHSKVTEGRITASITIFQHGEGNHSRELRVMGVDNTGAVGYFFKGVHPPNAKWVFVAVPGMTIPPEFHLLDPTLPEQLNQSKCHVYTGAVKQVRVCIEDFNKQSSPQTITLTCNGHKVKLTMHTTGTSRHTRGVIVVSDDIKDSTTEWVAEVYKNWFAKKDFVHVRISYDAKEEQIKILDKIPKLGGVNWTLQRGDKED